MTQPRKRLAHVVLTSVAICVGMFAAAAPAHAEVQTFSPAYAAALLGVPADPTPYDDAGIGSIVARVDVLPVIQIVKTVDPGIMLEPGGDFTFTLVITNTGPTGLTLTGLNDSIYGNLFDAANPNITNNTCSGLQGDALAPGASAAPCTFVGEFIGAAGDSETDNATITAIDENGTPVSDTDDAVATLVPGPMIEIVKTVIPGQRPAPGGNFTFTLVIFNPGQTDLTLSRLTDTIYGDLFDSANPGVTSNTCDDLEGDLLPATNPDSSVSCTFVGSFTGMAGDTETDIAEIEAIDENGVPVTDDDDAVVELAPGPAVQIVKTVDPGAMQAPGGDFTFTLVISNPGPTDLTLTTLVDTIYGNLFNSANPDVTANTCDDLSGDLLPATNPDSSVTCTFVGSFTGMAGDIETDSAEIDAIDENGNPVTDEDDAIVELVPVATVQIVKTANPLVMPAPGGDFTFTLVISNPGPTWLTLTELNDSIYGDLFDAGNPNVTGNTCPGFENDTLAPGASTAPCTFVGTFTGDVGDSETDIATIDAIDENGFPADDSDDAVVQLTQPPPTGGADFNGDGFADLAVGVPDEDVGAIASAGAVNVLYASASGLTGASSQLWHQNSTSVIDSAEADDHFGAAVTTGDFNGDGFSDLAVGVPDEDVGAAVDAGVAHVLHGSAAGLTAAASQYWGQNSAGVLDTGEAGDRFGASLAAGDLDGGARADLVVGAPGESVGAVADAGVVHVLLGTAGGLASAGNQLWGQNTTNIIDSAEAGDGFGFAVAVGDFTNDGRAELAIGTPGEDVGTVGDGGVVHMLLGSAIGPTATGSQYWSQNSGSVLDAVEAGDRFGAALTTGDFNDDGRADLGVGATAEGVGAVADAGAVNVLRGAAAGLTATGNQFFDQNSPGVSDSAETGDGFAAALAAGDFDDDGRTDLAVGVPDEDIGALVDGGVVHVLPGSASGVTATGSQYWNQNSSGIVEGVETGDSFGAGLVASPFMGAGAAGLAIGAPGESAGTVGGAGAVNVIYGGAGGLASVGNQLWTQISTGVPDVPETDDHFGAALG